MYLDFCNYNKHSTEDTGSQIKEIFNAINLGFDNVSVHVRTLREIKTYLKDSNITVSVPVDYPLGNSEKSVRSHQTLSALKAGASYIDLISNEHLLHNKKYIKFSDEVKAHLNMCSDYDAELRVVLEHSKYDLRKNIALAKILEESGVECVIPSTGFFRDDIYDNILVAQAIESRTNIKCIVSGHMWLDKHYDVAIKGTFFGLRAYSLKLF